MFMSRVKGFHGSNAGGLYTIPSASTVSLPDTGDVFLVSGSTKIDLLYANPQTYGRMVMLIGDSGGTAQLDNVNDAALVGQMDLGGSDLNVAAQDVVVLYCKMDGTWVRVSDVDN